MAEVNGLIIDTNIFMSLRKLDNLKKAFPDRTFFVTRGTLQELDRLKSAEGQRGFEARNGLRLIRENADLFQFLDTLNGDRPTFDRTKVDGDIIVGAANYDFTILTNDLSMASIATSEHVQVENFYEQPDNYSNGYFIKEVGEELKEENEFSVGLRAKEEFGAKVNQFIVLLEYGRTHTIFRVDEVGLTKTLTDTKQKVAIKSKEFGALTPKAGDIAQVLAFDMVGEQDISLLTGPAGSGKTLIMLAKQFEMLEKGDIQKITVFVNPEKARGAKTLGFYKGDRNLKLMQESIGGILASKFAAQGGPLFVEELIESGIVEVLPISDIRGYEVAPFSSLYITEAQNLNKDLMQLAIQRAADGCKIFIEGDPTTQLDSWAYEGDNNGMLKLIEVFSGHKEFCNINLNTVYRSKVAEIAEGMTK